MKNVTSFFVFAVILVFTSCTKEAIQPRQITSEGDVSIETMHQTSKGDLLTEPTANLSEQVAVTQISNSVAGSILTVEFTSSHDFTGETLESVQTLDFENGSGNTETLIFTVTNSDYTNGVLTVDFSIGGNSLLGLSMKSAQYIIIDDDVFN